MAALEVLLVILSVVAAGSTPYLAQAILQNRCHRKTEYERWGLTHLKTDPISPGAERFQEYLNWAVPLGEVSYEMATRAAALGVFEADGGKPESAGATSAIEALPKEAEIKRRYDLATAFPLSAFRLSVLCGMCGLALILLAMALELNPLTIIALTAILCATAVMVLTDTAARLIPTGATVALGVFGVLLQLAIGTHPTHIALSVLSGFAWAGICLVMNKVSRMPAIGSGDIKAVSILPLATGISGLMPALGVMLFALVLTLAIRLIRHGRSALSRRIPLAPYIATAVLVGVIWQAV